jgi:HAD superfamily hydrolase (TIGR01450 family)
VDGRELLASDLDGVVILDAEPIPHAVDAFAELRSRDLVLRFITNNASRPPEAVAETLRAIGVVADPDEVVTSAVGAAQVLAYRLPAGAPVLVVGGDGVRAALAAAGLQPVTSAADQPVAVLQGFAPEVDWPMLAEAAVAIRAGATWMATNLDRTLPSPRGPLPGNGSLVAALATATGQQPESVGKPEPTLYAAALADTDPAQALAVGDRLDTDIAGALIAGVDSLLVLTGVSGPRDLLCAAPTARPQFIGRDLRALFTPHPEAGFDDGAGRCGSARARSGSGRIELVDPTSGADRLDGLRALCALAWSAHGPDPTDTPGPYDDAIESLGLN